MIDGSDASTPLQHHFPKQVLSIHIASFGHDPNCESSMVKLFRESGGWSGGTGIRAVNHPSLSNLWKDVGILML